MRNSKYSRPQVFCSGCGGVGTWCFASFFASENGYRISAHGLLAHIFDDALLKQYMSNIFRNISASFKCRDGENIKMPKW